MAVNAISNDNLTDYRGTEGTSDFNPQVNYTVDAAAKEVDVTDSSEFPSGVALKRTHIRVHDKFGNTAVGTIEGPEGSPSPGADYETTVDIANLNLSKPLDITATVLGDDDKLVADGGAYNIGAAGELGSWDKHKSA